MHVCCVAVNWHTSSRLCVLLLSACGCDSLRKAAQLGVYCCGVFDCFHCVSAINYGVFHSVLSKILNLPAEFADDVLHVLEEEPQSPLKQRVLAQFLLKRSLTGGQGNTAQFGRQLGRAATLLFELGRTTLTTPPGACVSPSVSCCK